jgi:hypothetical protein
MTNESKIRITRLLAIIAVIAGLRFLGGGKAWDYLVDHVWLAVLLPLVGLVVLLFGRGMYIHHRQPNQQPKIGDSERAEP